VKKSIQHSSHEVNELSLDHILIQAVLEGDESAFELLLKRYQKKIHNFAYRFLGDAESAKDVAQETFLRFYVSLQKDREIEHLAAFLFKIARNCCIDIHRKNRLLSLNPSEMPVDHRTAFKVLDGKENRLKIETAIRLLPENQRVALLLRHTESLSYQEIGQVMSLSIPAVESLLFRARSRLRQILSPV